MAAVWQIDLDVCPDLGTSIWNATSLMYILLVTEQLYNSVPARVETCGANSETALLPMNPKRDQRQ